MFGLLFRGHWTGGEEALDFLITTSFNHPKPCTSALQPQVPALCGVGGCAWTGRVESESGIVPEGVIGGEKLVLGGEICGNFHPVGGVWGKGKFVLGREEDFCWEGRLR